MGNVSDCCGADTTGGRLTSPAGVGNEVDELETGASAVLSRLGLGVASNSVGLAVTAVGAVPSLVGSGVIFIIVGMGVGRAAFAEGFVCHE